MTDRISFSVPSTANAQVLTLAAANTSYPLTNPVFPAVADPRDPAYRRDGKALVSISGGGATYQSFANVAIARGTTPVATNTNISVCAGNTYLIEGLQSGDKLAFLAVGVTGILVTVTPVA